MSLNLTLNRITRELPGSADKFSAAKFATTFATKIVGRAAVAVGSIPIKGILPATLQTSGNHRSEYIPQGGTLVKKSAVTGCCCSCR